ncbi:MAG: NUDIX hydrolase [Gemmatimonadota bacterium]|nr:NUDIX hydrolase [Gemmatimonadota bacterium]
MPGKVSSRRVYTGRVISLDVDQVRFPDGTIGELEMIRHSGASAVVPLLDTSKVDPDVLLIRQYRYAADGYLYEIPAGRLDPDESPEECAGRELREETGYSARHVRQLTTIYTTPGFTDELIHIFVAEELTGGVANREPDEFMELHPIPLSQAVAMVHSGEIVDAKTALGLLLAHASHRPK